MFALKPISNRKIKKLKSYRKPNPAPTATSFKELRVIKKGMLICKYHRLDCCDDRVIKKGMYICKYHRLDCCDDRVIKKGMLICKYHRLDCCDDRVFFFGFQNYLTT